MSRRASHFHPDGVTEKQWAACQRLKSEGRYDAFRERQSWYKDNRPVLNAMSDLPVYAIGRVKRAFYAALREFPPLGE